MGCGRPIDLGSAKTVGQHGRHARISKKPEQLSGLIKPASCKDGLRRRKSQLQRKQSVPVWMLLRTPGTWRSAVPMMQNLSVGGEPTSQPRSITRRHACSLVSRITMKNGKPATQGVCPTCGTKMFRIGKS